MAQEIIIEIGPDGNVTVEGKGIEGSDCVKLTAEIEAALGDVTRKEKKPEFFHTVPLKRTVGR